MLAECRDDLVLPRWRAFPRAGAQMCESQCLHVASCTLKLTAADLQLV